MEDTPRWSGLAPLVEPGARWLVLGSFPGVASLKAQQYYGHPRNHFWRLMGDVLGTDLVQLPYEDRLLQLQQQRVALWDVIAETRRVGSLDSAIRDPVGNDLMALIDQLPALETIGFNGTTAWRHGVRQLGALAQRYRLIALPSSSPAHTMPYDDKLAVWRTLGRPSSSL